MAAKPAAASLKALKAKLRKAVKRRRRRPLRSRTATTKLQAAKEAGTPAIFAFQAASVALDDARTKHAAAKAALDRAQGLVANENTLWADLEKRMAAAEAGYAPLRDARDAAQAEAHGDAERRPVAPRAADRRRDQPERGRGVRVAA